MPAVQQCNNSIDFGFVHFDCFSLFMRAGLHLSELNVNSPATSSVLPAANCGPSSGAVPRYGKEKVNA